jgi:hypothetical protein
MFNPKDNDNLTSNLIPGIFQSDANKKFLQSTVDQLIKPGTVKKTNGYIGRQNAKASRGDDVYLDSANAVRQNYQLEPGITINDDLKNVTFFKDYQDYINELSIFGSNIKNHNRLNRQEFYSWNPHIDWDKFSNYQQYYWLPYGPDAVEISGQQLDIVSTYQVRIEDQISNSQWILTPDGLTPNPLIKLYRGQTYIFEINSPGHPFTLSTVRSINPVILYQTPGLDNNSISEGTITFEIPYDAPDILYYFSANDLNAGGVFQILSIEENTFLDVEKDIVGKKTYTLSNGVSLSNGMKVKFSGNVLPETYANSQYYVEGVGESIVLIEDKSLEIISPYVQNVEVLFDTDPFDALPFANADSYPGKQDYITINRASKDKNPWSRYNRWFHKDVIETSAALNNTTPVLDQSARAVRPIIEFEAGLQLYNFGSISPVSVDLIDDFTTDVFSTIEGSLGYNIDGIDLAPGHHVLFTADTDNLVRSNVYRVQFLNVGARKQIHLELIHTPNLNDNVLIKNGVKNQSNSYWFNGSNWVFAQQKTTTNQQPLFDLFDIDGHSFSNTEKYQGSTFKGTKLFSYSLGDGVNDPVLGFPLTYKNINNIGDIVFDFNITNDTFVYKSGPQVVNQVTNIGFLKKYNLNKVKFVNGWEISSVNNVQAAVRIYKNSSQTNNFDIDIFDNISDLSDLFVKVYVNGKRLDFNSYQILDGSLYKFILLNEDISLDDVLTVKAYATQSINDKGFYEIPANLQNNPLNKEITSFTLGEILDHVDSIVENLPTYSENNAGGSNLRDLGNVTRFGIKFVQHSGPLSLSLYHITNKDNNIVRAIEKTKNDYVSFKRKFINMAVNTDDNLSDIELVDQILRKINENKSTFEPYYFSDMVPYGASLVSNINVLDRRIKTYPLTSAFDLSKLSAGAVLIYRNGEQLIYGKDYNFDFLNSNFILTESLEIANGDVLTTYEFDNTNGCFVPETPTKLGLYPAYEPEIFIDNTLLMPRQMIRGHDGSLTLAYGDRRDFILLELEKRIFNNIKESYDVNIFDMYDILPGYNRKTDYTLQEFNEVLSYYFQEWIGLTNADFSTPVGFDSSNPFTYNYSGNYALNGEAVPGFWRGIYKWMFDTDRPHTHPWEMLGFTSKPLWWEQQYGPAPYTRNNLILWNDLSEGIVREPNTEIKILSNFVRPILKTNTPVDEFGNLLSPYNSALVRGTITPTVRNDYVFGDVGPVENAWRRSSYYPYAILLTSILLHPAKTIGVLFDKSKTQRNPAGQYIYSDTLLRIKPSDVGISSIYSSDVEVRTAGLVNFIVNYTLSENLESYNRYKQDLQRVHSQLTYRLGAFTSKEKFDIILESRTPLSSSNSVFVPKENYEIVFNISSPVRKIVYSGVIITRVGDGFIISGYSKDQRYFKYYEPLDSGTVVNVGGVSESYVEWSRGNTYYTGQIVRYNKQYYKVILPQSVANDFDKNAYVLLKALPFIGGVNSSFKSKWNKITPLTLFYGKKLSKIQDVVDFLLGHGEYLKDQGFIFEDFNSNLSTISNWQTSAKEFLFWTTQNWSTSNEKWTDWTPNKSVEYNEVVRYNGEYYQALQKISATSSYPVTNLSVEGETNGYTLTAQNVDGVYIGMKVTGTGIGNNSLVQSISGFAPYTIYLTEKNIADVSQATFTGFFNENLYVKLEGLDTIGSSVISLSPSANKITFKSDLSIVNSLTDRFYDYSIFKVDGTPLQPQFIDTYRNGNQVVYGSNNNEGIFGATFYLIQQEQVLILDNETMFNDLIYNPETGYRRERLKISGYTSIDWDGSLNAPGFIVDQAIIQEWQAYKDYSLGDIVLHQQYYYSANTFIAGTDKFTVTSFNGDTLWNKLDTNPVPKLIPNWTYKATQFTDFYSLDSDNFDAGQQELSQHLVGYQKRQYLENIIQDSVGEFKFYQGMIYDKGTKNSFDKLFGVLQSSQLSGLNYYEEWALRSGQYGSANGYNEIEFVLNEEDFTKRNPQGYELVEQSQMVYSDFINRLTPNDLYIKPSNYNSKPWPLISNYKSYLRSAGYVRPGEVSLVLKSVDDILDEEIDNLLEGNYIWCGFEKNSWNIYRFTALENPVNSVTYQSTTSKLTVSFNNVHDFSVNSIIGFKQSVIFDGFYKVLEVTPTSISFNVTLTGSLGNPFSYLKDIVSFKLSSQRASSIDVADTVFPQEFVSGELLWTDDNGQGLWTTWKNEPVYNGSEIFYTNPVRDLGFGREIAVSQNGRIAAVATKTGQVLTYYKASSSASWVQRDFITEIPISKSNAFGVNLNEDVKLATVLALSDDGVWLAVGSPNAGYACTKYKQSWSNTTEYNLDDIVLYDNNFYKSITESNTNHNPLEKAFWRLTYYIPVDLKGTNSSNVNHGAVSLYKKDNNNLFTFVNTILSPNFSSNEQFGSALDFSQTLTSNGSVSYSLFVGAKGYNNNLGRVYEIKYDQVVQASSFYNPYGSSDRSIIDVTINVPGINYTVPPAVIIPAPTAPGGIKAEAFSRIGVSSVKLIQAGSGYLPGDLLVVSGGTYSSPAILRVTSVNTKFQLGNIGAIKAVSIFTPGEYEAAPPILANIVTGGSGTNARFNLEIGVSKVTITDPGAGYTTAPFITFSGSGSGANATAILGTTITLSSTSGIEPGMSVSGEGFESNQIVSRVINNRSIVVNNNPSMVPSGRLLFSTFEWSCLPNSFIPSPVDQYLFGSSITSNIKNNTVVITSVGQSFVENEVPGKVNVFRKNNNSWSLLQTISRDSTVTGDVINFGLGIDLSADGLFLAIGDAEADEKFSGQGIVKIYSRSSVTNNFNFFQRINDIKPQANGYFGSRVAWMNDGSTLVIYSQNSDIDFLQTFDRYKDVYQNSMSDFGSSFVLDPTSGENTRRTTFDGDSTQFRSIVRNNGRVDVYDRYNINYIYSETLEDFAELNSEYGDGFSVGNDTILIGAPSAHINSQSSGRVFAFNKKAEQYSWKKLHQEIPKVNLSKFKRALIYNKVTGNLVTYLDIIDPMQGKIPGPAEQELKFKTFYDPAIYSNGDSTVNVNQGQAWSEKHVGQLWWDLRTAKFIDAQDDDVVYRNNSWAILFPGASIDIYEWVGSQYTPSQWNALADTVAGLSQNISGQSLYGDSIYSRIQKYNNITKSYKNTYYFWVKNKTIVPNVIGRSMSAKNISNLIANPRGENYKFLALTGENSFSVANLKSILQDRNMVLSIEYWTIDNPEHAQIHRQYSIINNDVNTVLPDFIQEKWFDSLCGKDKNGNLVPDPRLPAKLRYGIENRPRQGLFINRFEALKQILESVNIVLKKYQIVEYKDVSALNSYDVPPSTLSGLYDIVKDTDYDLRFVSVGNFSKPDLRPIIKDGKITGVNIQSSGSGYVNPPYVTVSGQGKGAILKSKINALGQITGVDIISSGEGYNDSTTSFTVRSYSVLVNADSGSQDYWSIFTYDTVTNNWSRIITQSFDVRPYWTYIDWYDSGYNQFTSVDYFINSFIDLLKLDASIGELVKVKNNNSGNWTLLEKYSNNNSVDWTQSYKTVGLQNGTIQFSSDLYSLTDTIYGFDGALYDDLNFDNAATQELRIILNSLKNDILTGELKKEYLNLFFASIRYIISEQVNVDWIFKTSFVKADHLIGNLDQTSNYQPDNLADYQNYISEVKPYRTKVREYVDNYTNQDVSNTSVTDFDLPTIYQNGQLNSILTNYSNDIVSVSNVEIDSIYPWKHWTDNIGYEVIELRIVDPGAGYFSPPEIIIQSASGSGATAKAFLSNGSIRNILLLTNGSGYLSAPTVVINGGFSNGGRSARIVALIGNSVVRTAHIGMKFDRLSKSYSMLSLEKTEAFTQTGTKVQFVLKWPIDLRAGTSAVTINGLTALKDTYSFTLKESKSSGYTRKYGVIVFENSPPLNANIVVTYLVNWNLLNAEDRIQFYYNPIIGQPGKDLAQLMTGIDYGGATVSSFDFNTSYGWDTSSSFNDVWDGFDSSFKDYIAIVNSDFDYKFNLPYVPSLGTELNVYYSEYFTEEFIGDNETTQFLFDARQQTPSANIRTQSNIDNAIVFTFKGLGIKITGISGTGSLVTVTFENRTQTPFQTGDIINISGVQSTVGSNTSFSYYNGIHTVFSATTSNVIFQSSDSAFYFSGGVISFVNKQVIDVNSSSGLQPGMKIIRTTLGSNKVISSIKSIINNTLVEIDSPLDPISLSLSTTLPSNEGTNTLTFRSTKSLIQGSQIIGGSINLVDNITINIVSSTQVNISSLLTTDIESGTLFTFTYTTLPEENEQILATFNAKGSSYLSVANTSNIKINDNVSLVQNDLSLFSVSTRVVEIINNNLIKLNNILYDTVLNVGTYSAKFTRDLDINPKISITGAGLVDLIEAPKVGEIFTIFSYLAPVRIDGDNNVMDTVIADGVSNEVIIPNTFVVNDLDKFIIRESTSDGSIEPLTTTFDTKLDGGNLAYTTASGLEADDIIVDGDAFVTPTTSAYPEEVVPGQIIDTLAIKVYDRPSTGSAKVLVRNYNYMSGNKIFDIGQQPNTSSAIIVKTTFENQEQILTAVQDYLVDYQNAQIQITSSLSANTIVTIFSLGFSGNNIIGFDYFVGNGSTKEFVTNVKWISGITSYVSINGESTPVLIFETDETYDSANRVGFRFIDAPPNQSLIYFMLIAGSNNQTFAITSKQLIEFDGRLVYDLDNIVGNLLPNETNMIVRDGNKILNAPKNYYFTVTDDQLVYEVDPGSFAPFNIVNNDITVIVDNVILQPEVDYEIIPAAIRIVLYQTTYLKYEGSKMIVSIAAESGYVYIPPISKFDKPKIHFKKPPESSTVEVISFYRNDILDIKTVDINLTPVYSIVPQSPEYFTYRNIFGGILKLESTVLSEDCVWVIKNETLLTPSIDYVLNSDYSSITLAVNPNITDKIKIIVFGGNILTSGISYMQFKDMLNRTSYIRLSANKQTKLAADLRATDKTIIVEDASNFDTPNPALNKPGIIEIRGERIEYFTLQGNVLGQLRRGTLGTGVPKLHKQGSVVQDIGTSETIFYNDTVLTQQIVSNGTNIVNNLNYVPSKIDGNWVFESGFDTSIPATFNQCDEIEVFAGGYNIHQWEGSVNGEPGKSYNVGDFVLVNGYNYKCNTNHVSSISFINDAEYWDFFIANVRLSKTPYKVYNINKAPVSPDGDVQFDADFSVDGTSNSLRLTTPLDSNVVITVVKRTGKDWDSVVNIMNDTGKIAEFLKASPGAWYTGIENYALTINTAETFDNSDVTFDSSDYKVD